MLYYYESNTIILSLSLSLCRYTSETESKLWLLLLLLLLPLLVDCFIIEATVAVVLVVDAMTAAA